MAYTQINPATGKEIPSDRRSCCKERRKGTGNR